MTLFWILCAVLLLVAMLFVALPLWRKTSPGNDVLRDAANLGILRDQSAELETDLRNGLLTRETYEQGKHELQARLLEEVKISGQPVKPPRDPAKPLAIVLAVLLPIFSVSLYLTIGNPDALLPQETIAADADGIIRSDEALQRLGRKLKRTPNNPDDWWILARSYTELKRFAEAAKAYQELVKLVPDEAQLWANYADVFAMAHGQTLQGEEVVKLLGKALELDANNMTALALSGSAAMERGNYAAAITYWQKLISQVQPGSEDAQMFNGGIQRARELLLAQPGGREKLAQLPSGGALAPVAANPAAAITGSVSLSPALAGKVAPADTVFIFARAAQGPNMPLAVLRKQVKDLPMKFTLDDSMAMQPQLKLSGFDQVVVVARVSKSGTPIAQPGDLQGLSGAIKPGTKGLNIVIDSDIP
ncbi:MAG: c-type cytochrome biogenesis protein CcmI [Betaproteobacteria bacterium RBG_16_56_24]|nr:MAG: c-type cytochrome biogenesis protein CcmI [Betaproteobacteria bacterium RBG_16_56_24]